MIRYNMDRYNDNICSFALVSSPIVGYALFGSTLGKFDTSYMSIDWLGIMHYLVLYLLPQQLVLTITCSTLFSPLLVSFETS